MSDDVEKLRREGLKKCSRCHKLVLPSHQCRRELKAQPGQTGAGAPEDYEPRRAMGGAETHAWFREEQERRRSRQGEERGDD